MGRWKNCEGFVYLIGHYHTILVLLALCLYGHSSYLSCHWVPLLLAEDARQKTGAEPGFCCDLLFLVVSLASCPLHSPHRLLSLRPCVQIPPLGQVTPSLWASLSSFVKWV